MREVEILVSSKAAKEKVHKIPSQVMVQYGGVHLSSSSTRSTNRRITAQANLALKLDPTSKIANTKRSDGGCSSKSSCLASRSPDFNSSSAKIKNLFLIKYLDYFNNIYFTCYAKLCFYLFYDTGD
jgi:hypothetical protein